MKYSAKYTKNNGHIYFSRDYSKEDKNKITVRIPSKNVEEKEWIEQLFYENIF